MSAGRVKWGECSEWGARERESGESWVSAVREWSERSESEWARKCVSGARVE